MVKENDNLDILELYKDSSIPLRDISEAFNVSMSTITKLAQSKGLSRREPYTIRTPELDAVIIEKLQQGYNVSSVCSELGVSRAFIRNTAGANVAIAKYKEQEKVKAEIIGTMSHKKLQVSDILDTIQELAQTLHDSGATFKDVVDFLEPLVTGEKEEEKEVKDVGTVNLYNPIIL